jgi:hypothetical protein
VKHTKKQTENSLEKVKTKLDMLDTLDDLEVASALMAQQAPSEEGK